MQIIKKTTTILFVLFSCVGCDQATKSLARQNLAGIEPISMFNDIFRFQYAENPGAFLSFGANIPEHVRYAIFTLLIGVFLLVFTAQIAQFDLDAVEAPEFLGCLIPRVYIRALVHLEGRGYQVRF